MKETAAADRDAPKDQQTEDGEKPAAAPERKSSPKMRRRRKFLLILLALVVVLGALGAFLYHELVGRFYESTDDAYVNGNIVPVTPRVAGTVVSITADDGDYVAAGQVLVRLDPSDTAVALRDAEASLAKTVRQVRGLYSNADYARAQLAASEVAYERARADYQRRRNLADSGAIPAEEIAHALDTLNQARESLDAARHTLDTSVALVDNTRVESHPEVKAASAQLQQRYLDHLRTVVTAPVSGYVARRTVQLGSHVSSGDALLSVVPLEQVWIDANFKESQMREMRIGQPVDIVVDLYGKKVPYRGTIESLGIGTGSAFALLPAQNATGNWIKIVQRLPVRVQLEPDNLASHPLRIGLSTKVTVDLHDDDGPLLPRQPLDAVRFATDVYEHELADANALIERIIRANDPGESEPAAAKKRPAAR